MKSKEVMRTAWYQKDRVGAVERIADILTVIPHRDANLISLVVSDAAPWEQDQTDLAEIVNAVARAYVDNVSERANRGRAEHISRLKGKLAVLQEQFDTILAEIKRKNLPVMPIIRERIKTHGARLQALTGEIVRLELPRTQTEDALKDLDKQAADGTIKDMPELMSMVEADPNIKALRRQEFNLNTSHLNLLKRVGPNHRSVMMTRTWLATVRERLAQATGKSIVDQTKALKEQYKSVLEKITEQLLYIKAQIAKIEGSVEVDLQRNLLEMRDLRAREAVKAGNIGEINKTLLRLELLLDADRPVWLRAPATRPKEISNPKWSLTMPLGFMIGLALGLGLAFLLELMDTSIKGPADLAKRVDLPILGMIPHADDLDEDFEQIPLAFMEHPNSLICEAHRQIRTCLLFSGPPSRQRSLLISSPLPGDGRTTLSLNLAHSIAQGGRRVLVVDANFHQPAVTRLFPQCPEQGLSNVLVGQGNWRELVVEIEPNLGILGAGRLPPNPAELLGSEQMRDTIAEMVEAYDQVLLDGPPCLVVADPLSLSTLVDGVVLVVRAGANTFGIVQRVRDMFLRVGAHVIGVALNGVRVVAGGYLRKSYETFYEYREQAQLPLKQE